MIRWGHGHSTVLGAVLAAALLRGHYLWALTFAFAFGVAVGRSWGLLAAFLRRAAVRWPVVEGRSWRRS